MTINGRLFKTWRLKAIYDTTTIHRRMEGHRTLDTGRAGRTGFGNRTDDCRNILGRFIKKNIWLENVGISVRGKQRKKIRPLNGAAFWVLLGESPVIKPGNYLREEDRSEREFSLLLPEDAALLPLLREVFRLTVELRLEEELLLCGLTEELLLLLLELFSGFTVLLLLLDGLLCGVTEELLLLLLELFSGFTVELLLLDGLLCGVTEELLLLLVELLLLTEVLVVELLPLFASGRYTLTVLPRTVVVLPERLFELSSLCTVTFRPVACS